jgi:type IV secretory pathway VirB10-like protein
MKTDRKHALTVSAALFATTLTIAGCSREIGDDQAARSANEAARSAAEATDELVDANNALLLRVEELESRLADAEERRVERTAAPAADSSYRVEPEQPAYRAAPMPSRTYSRPVTAEVEDYVLEPARTEYRYDERYEATPVLADTSPAWSTNSRLRDVPQPYRPPEREVERRSEPTWRRLTIEEGTPIAVEILDPISTKYSRPGDSFNARLASDLLADNGRVAIRKGAEISGHVAEVRKNQRIGGRAKLLVTMDRIDLPDGSTAPIEAAWSTQGKSQTPKDAATIGGATVGGAILGRILDHGDGDVIGGLLGAAAGTAVAHQKVGQPITLGSGAVIHMHLRAPVEVRVRN